jgi:hypothetical protein
LEVINNNSEIPDYMKPIYHILLSEKNKDSYLDICNKWTFEDYIFYQHAIADEGLIQQVLMKDLEKGK